MEAQHLKNRWAPGYGLSPEAAGFYNGRGLQSNPRVSTLPATDRWCGTANITNSVNSDNNFDMNVNDFPDVNTAYGIEDREEVFAKHLTITSNSFARRNVFIRSKIIKAVLGEDCETGIRMKVISDKDDNTKKSIEITVNSERQSRCLLRQKKLGEDEVIVEKHPFKNLVHGVFYDQDDLLKGVEKAEVLEGLKEWNATIHDISKLGQGEDSKMWKVTFESLSCPRRIKVAFGRDYKVDIYVPPPIRCFKCQEYGHTIKTCRETNPYRCQKCSKVYTGPHDHIKCKAKACESKHCYKDCKEPTLCFACKGNDHQTGSPTCLEQQYRKDINFFMYRKGLSRKDATRQADIKRDTGGKGTYNSVVAGQNIQATSQVENRLKSLEDMFKTFLDTMTNNETAGSTGGLAAIHTKLSDQQRQIEEITERYDAEAQKCQKLKTMCQQGYDEYEKLKINYKNLEAENEALLQKQRDLMIDSKKETYVDPKKEAKKRHSSSSSPEKTASKVLKGGKPILTDLKMADDTKMSIDTLPPPPKPPVPRNGGQGGGNGRGTGGGSRGGNGGGRGGSRGGGTQQQTR